VFARVRRATARQAGWLLALLTLAPSVAGAWALSGVLPLASEDEFNVMRWELRHAPNKWLYLTGRFFAGGLSREEEDERLGRYLLLTARARAVQREGGSASEIADLLDERDGLESEVEAILEGRLTAVLEEEQLESTLLPFPRLELVFPPVDFELGRPPLVLAVSRRDRIELVEQRPLRTDLDLQAIERIEAEEERSGARSALVDDIGGVALYPSLVAPRAHYASLVETVAHEWAHQYLSFRPLGRRYFSSLELRTLNETVADLAGRELAALVVARYPLPADVAAQIEALAPPPPALDVSAALVTLRVEVEALLAEGEIEEAEALMERRRLGLAAQGVRFRRINQAFFAWRGLYAGDPAALDPLGEKIEALFAREGSAGAFLRAASRLTSEAALDELLAR
jgi:hypothetical protein